MKKLVFTIGILFITVMIFTSFKGFNNSVTSGFRLQPPVPIAIGTRFLTPVPIAIGTRLPTPDSDTLHYPEETHFKNVQQLTFGGDNAEAYWSYDNKYLVFQRTSPKDGVN